MGRGIGSAVKKNNSKKTIKDVNSISSNLVSDSKNNKVTADNIINNSLKSVNKK